MTLRYYQKDAVENVLTYLEEKQGNPLVVLPTGSGKTHVLAELCRLLSEKDSEVKILIISHVKEILTQDYKQLKKFVPEDLIGIYSSGLNSFERKKYTIASIQSIYKFGRTFKDYTYIIIDEAHLIPPTGEGRYKTFFKGMPQARIIGLTATPFRLGHGWLTDNHLFDKIVYDTDIVELISKGFLSQVTTKEPGFEMPTENLKIVAGDFSKRSLQVELDREEISKKILLEVIKYKDTRKKWLIFAIDIAHAENINTILNNLGIRSAAIHSKLDFDRTLLTDLYKEGLIQSLVSVETLTTGFDVPDVDLIALMRPTQSPVLHVQMIGRGMRIAPNKENCLVLDFAGNTKRLGPINDVYVKTKNEKSDKKGKGSFTKTCPECKEILAIKTKECPCGYKFKFEQKLELKPTTEEIIKTKQPVIKANKFKVHNIQYTKHVKIGGSVSLKVTYKCGLRSFSEWVGLEHIDFPRKRAESWWRYRAGTTPPSTVKEALLRVGELHTPEAIYVLESGQYPQIIKYEFAFEK